MHRARAAPCRPLARAISHCAGIKSTTATDIIDFMPDLDLASCPDRVRALGPELLQIAPASSRLPHKDPTQISIRLQLCNPCKGPTFFEKFGPGGCRCSWALSSRGFSGGLPTHSNYSFALVGDDDRDLIYGTAKSSRRTSRVLRPSALMERLPSPRPRKCRAHPLGGLSNAAAMPFCRRVRSPTAISPRHRQTPVQLGRSPPRRRRERRLASRIEF